jgi:hypothetical protein
MQETCHDWLRDHDQVRNYDCLLESEVRKRIGSPTWIRTTIHGSKGRNFSSEVIHKGLLLWDCLRMGRAWSLLFNCTPPRDAMSQLTPNPLSNPSGAIQSSASRSFQATTFPRTRWPSMGYAGLKSRKLCHRELNRRVPRGDLADPTDQGPNNGLQPLRYFGCERSQVCRHFARGGVVSAIRTQFA